MLLREFHHLIKVFRSRDTSKACRTRPWRNAVSEHWGTKVNLLVSQISQETPDSWETMWLHNMPDIRWDNFFILQLHTAAAISSDVTEVNMSDYPTEIFQDHLQNLILMVSTHKRQHQPVQIASPCPGKWMENLDMWIFKLVFINLLTHFLVIRQSI